LAQAQADLKTSCATGICDFNSYQAKVKQAGDLLAAAQAAGGSTSSTTTTTGPPTSA
jgi:hypothetical protein